MVETAGVAPTYVHWSSDWCQIFYDENTGPKMLINILIGTHECQGIIYSLTASSPAWTYGIYLVRPTGLEPVLAKANCPLKTACLPTSTRNAYFILKLEADGLKPSCHLL